MLAYATQYTQYLPQTRTKIRNEESFRMLEYVCHEEFSQSLCSSELFFCTPLWVVTQLLLYISLKLNAGELALVEVYKDHETDTLDYLRFKRFHQRVGSSTSLVRHEVLPPTSAAAEFHSTSLRI
jgi:hypothetical protein